MKLVLNTSLRKNKAGLNAFRFTMLLPALVVLFAINLAPIVDTLISSLQEYYLPAADERHFIGIRDYINLIKDARFLNSLKLTTIFVIGTVTAETIAALSISLVLVTKFRTARLVRGILLLPIFLTPITISFMWRIMFAPTLGILNYFLELLGLPPQLWVFAPEQALGSIMLVGAWYRMPVMMLIIFTGLLTIPNDLTQAAAIDGASYLQELFRIKIPLISPVIMVAVLFQTIDQAKWFDGIYILTRGGPGTATETLSVFTYIHGFGFLRMGYASAGAILLSLFIGLLALFVVKIGGVHFD